MRTQGLLGVHFSINLTPILLIDVNLGMSPSVPKKARTDGVFISYSIPCPAFEIRMLGVQYDPAAKMLFNMLPVDTLIWPLFNPCWKQNIGDPMLLSY